MEHASSLTGSIAFDIAIVFILVLANSFFVASEFALVSVRKTRIDQLADLSGRAIVEAPPPRLLRIGGVGAEAQGLEKMADRPVRL